jgi:hypothetical protein
VSHTSPHPVRVRYHDPDMHTFVLRGIGSRIECPFCNEAERSRSWSELRVWLRQHIAEKHAV